MEGAKSNGMDAMLNTCSNQEKADTLLIFHALHVFQIAGKITIITLFNYCPVQISIVETLRLPPIITGNKRGDVYLEPI